MNLFEVFDEIRVKSNLENVFQDVEVVKVTASRSTGKTTIHLQSRRLIEYQDLIEMEQALYGQFFGPPPFSLSPPALSWSFLPRLSRACPVCL